MPPQYNFSDALERLKAGAKLRRLGWNGIGMHLAVQFPDEGSMNKKPYIYIIPVDGERVPWTASHGDLFANDWVVIE